MHCVNLYQSINMMLSYSENVIKDDSEIFGLNYEFQEIRRNKTNGDTGR